MFLTALPAVEIDARESDHVGVGVVSRRVGDRRRSGGVGEVSPEAARRPAAGAVILKTAGPTAARTPGRTGAATVARTVARPGRRQVLGAARQLPAGTEAGSPCSRNSSSDGRVPGPAYGGAGPGSDRGEPAGCRARIAVRGSPGGHGGSSRRTEIAGRDSVSGHAAGQAWRHAATDLFTGAEAGYGRRCESRRPLGC